MGLRAEGTALTPGSQRSRLKARSAMRVVDARAGLESGLRTSDFTKRLGAVFGTRFQDPSSGPVFRTLFQDRIPEPFIRRLA
jgi:hypothetical protein